MIELKHSTTGVVKEAPTGYSWTTLFFGIFVPLLRGDLKWAIILLLICLVTAFCTAGFGAIFVTPIFGFFYNKIYIKDLIEKGYVYIDEAGKKYLVSNGIISYTDVMGNQAEDK